jgi:uncharacterized protein (DUF3820 family)
MGIKQDIDNSGIDKLGKSKFPFGQYKNKTIIEVFLLDKQYVLWAYSNCKSNMLLFKYILKTFLEKMTH